MTAGPVFIDTAVLAHARYDAPHRPACVEVLRRVADGRLSAVTSVLVLEELWHLELRGRPPLPPGTARAAAGLFRSVLDLRAAHLTAALDLPESALGAADRLHVAVALDAGCEVVISPDRDFDDAAGLRRVDPSDAAAVQALGRQ